MPPFIVKVVLVTGVFAGQRISVINQYSNRRPRNPRFLKGNPEGYKECHLKPDLLIVYRVYRDEVQLIDIGSHSELFE